MLLQVATKVQLEIYIKHTRLILKNSHEDEHEDGLKKIIKEFKKKPSSHELGQMDTIRILIAAQISTTIVCCRIKATVTTNQ